MSEYNGWRNREKCKSPALEFSTPLEKRRYNAWSRLSKNASRRWGTDAVMYKTYADKAYYSCAVAIFTTNQPLEQTAMNIGRHEPAALEKHVFEPARTCYRASEPKQINQQLIHACTTEQVTPPIVLLEYGGKAYSFNKTYLENLLICISPTKKQATYIIDNYRIYLVGDMGEAVLAGIKGID